MNYKTGSNNASSKKSLHRESSAVTHENTTYSELDNANN